MKKIKVYVAGKISKDSVFGTHDWRDGFCRELSEKSGFKIVNLDPTKGNNDFDQNDPRFVYGRNSFMIKLADVVIVNLTDDISVGGSQEMLIAKYYKKPLIGIAPRGGKFNKDEKEFFGKIYKNYIDSYVSVACDFVAGSIDEAADAMRQLFSRTGKKRKIKDLSILDDAIRYYEKNFFGSDKFLHL